MKSKLQINDLDLELASLYMTLSSEWDDTIMEDYVVYDIKASEQLNDPAVGVTYPDESKVIDPAGFDDTLCNAALFIYEEQEYEQEVFAPSYQQDESSLIHAAVSFITNEQKETNFKYYMEKLAKANNFKKLAEVRETVLSGQQSKNGMYFFPAGCSAKFWAAYNKQKEQLNNKVKINKILYK